MSIDCATEILLTEQDLIEDGKTAIRLAVGMLAFFRSWHGRDECPDLVSQNRVIKRKIGLGEFKLAGARKYQAQRGTKLFWQASPWPFFCFNER